MAARNNDLLNFKANDGPVWVRGQDINDSQPVIRLWTQEREVIVPASSLLASSLMLRQILSSGDFLPVPYHAPVVILPNVTVNVAKHVIDLVTIGKTDANDPEVIKKHQGNFGNVKNTRQFELGWKCWF